MKKLGDVLELIPDYMNVSVVDKLHVEIARYDGRDSIPASMNEYEVLDKKTYDNTIRIVVDTWSDISVAKWKLFILDMDNSFKSDNIAPAVYLVPQDRVIDAQIAADIVKRLDEEGKTNCSPNYINYFFSLELQKRKVPHSFVGRIRIPYMDRENANYLDESIPMARI